MALKSATAFASYIRSARQLFLTAPSPSLQLVVGNEAADADSVVSAMTYAYLLHCQSCTEPREIFLPLVCSPMSDSPLRRDTETLLKYAHLSLADVLCIDEYFTQPASFSSSSSIRENKLQLHLVDHNAMSQAVLSKYSFEYSVKSILDHHADANQWLDLPADKRVIAFDIDTQTATVGSACTLVAERFLAENERYLADNTSQRLLSTDIATLLLGVICADTMNMDVSAGRGTPRDALAINRLQELLPALDRNQLYNSVANSKRESSFWSSLSARDVFRVDYKAFATADGSSIGIASVLMPLHELIAKDDFTASSEALLTSCASDQRLSFLAVMGVTFEPFARELLFICPISDREKVTAFIAEGHADGLELSLVSEATTSGICCLLYKQSATKMSRKQVAPILQKYRI